MFHDIRYAIRMLRKDAAFTLVAVLSLALGTGANSTMFSIVNGMLIRPLPVSEPSAVLTISPKFPDNSFEGISYPDYQEYRDRSRTMKDLVATMLYRFGFSATPDALPKVKYGLLVSGNLFDAMRVKPVLGRAFRPEEDQVPGRDAVLVLGYDFWKQEFGSDPKILGRRVRLNNVDFTIIGVAPETFTGMDEFFKADMFAPVMMSPSLQPEPGNNALVRRQWREFAIKGRLRPGVDAAQAEAEVVGIAKRLEELYPDTNAGRSVALRTETQIHFQHLPRETGVAVLAMIMASLVLMIACFNVANLALSRGRSREVAIRLAMGARRWRLVRQLLTESALIGIAGLFVGVWFAWGVDRLFSRIRVPSDLPFFVDVRSDYRVLLFSFAAALVSLLVFGLIPALQSSKLNLAPALKSAGEAAVTLRNKLWGRNSLVVAQIAISVVLLVLATMVYNGFRTQFYAGAGFRTDHVLMMSFDPRLVRYDAEQANQFYKQLLERAQSSPGVKSVSSGATMPLAINQRSFTIGVAREERQPGKDRSNEKDHILHNVVDPEFFNTFGIPIVRGRNFNASDMRDAPQVVIVNEVLANRYWPGADPVGKRIRIDIWARGEQSAEVVGVARTCKCVLMTEGPTDYLYMPVAQDRLNPRTLFVQSNGDSAALTGSIRELVRRIDPNMPVYDVRTIEEYFQGWVHGSADTVLFMLGSMGVTGLILAMIGLYGLVSYSVNRRKREFGIRMAIGARKDNVLRMVLGQGTSLCICGIVIGALLSLPAGRVLATAVFTAGTDWTPYVVVPALLVVVTLAATFGPARRAAAIDPMKALREE
jgi:predicted permease